MPKRRPSTRQESTGAPSAPVVSRGSRLDVEVDHGETAWSVLGDTDPDALVAEVAMALSTHTPLPAAVTTATVSLSSDAEVRALNQAWRGQDKPTNVLSFPSPPPPATGRFAGPHFLGDVILAEATVAREAAALEIAVADHFRHLVLHGLLHLLGFDHETEPQAVAMEGLETQILAALGVADPYAGTEPVDASVESRA